jgi:hypothetical protein
MKIHGGADMYLHALLISAFIAVEESALRPHSFNPGDIASVPTG